MKLLTEVKRLKSLRPLELRAELDDWLVLAYNYMSRRNERRQLPASIKDALQKNSELHHLHQGKRCFIIGNGPSVNQQNLVSLKDEVTFVVNRFPHHKLAQDINPTYYVSVDPKFADGSWGTDFIKQVEEKMPNTTCFLSPFGLDFVNEQGLISQNKKYVIWPNQQYCFGYKQKIDLTKGIPGMSNVTKSALSIAMYMGFTEINLIGIDGNGLIKSENSHFYGHEPQPEDQFVLEKDLVSMSMGLRAWRAIHSYCNRFDVKLQSINPETVLSAIPQGHYPNLQKDTSN
ncbi:MAG: hypothetical protein CMH56_16375 [Myxococcales bacterium]|nr:hypothetical protein [Myxococcales bacterium]|tara:strand:+ start:1832 stop:2695 length:864 start_codon:yes stop_codon:yes gene_type:complete